jgi:hypothetical protein
MADLQRGPRAHGLDMVSLFSQVVVVAGGGGITTTISWSSLSEMMDSSPRRGIMFGRGSSFFAVA